MGDRTRVVATVAAIATIGATSYAYAAVGPLDEPAAVTTRAERINPPTTPIRPLELRAAFAMVELVNAERSRRGLPILHWHDQVGAAARAHAADMAANRRMQHAGSDGSNAGIRLLRAGYDHSTWGENIGAGSTTAEPLFEAWVTSAGHRRHLLGDFAFIRVGAIAAADGTPYWALVVAT